MAVTVEYRGSCMLLPPSTERMPSRGTAYRYDLLTRKQLPSPSSGAYPEYPLFSDHGPCSLFARLHLQRRERQETPAESGVQVLVVETAGRRSLTSSLFSLKGNGSAAGKCLTAHTHSARSLSRITHFLWMDVRMHVCTTCRWLMD